MTVAFADKFVAFVDVMGFSNLIRDSESGVGPPLSEILALLSDLGNEKDRADIAADGPHLCPKSKRLSRDAAFQITQISDCVIASAEASPIGVLTLVHHCLKASFRLLRRGRLCCGFITRGNVYQTPTQVLGTGYMEAYRAEANVAAFADTSGDKHTPFIEVGPKALAYIQNETDECVRKVFERLTVSVDDFTVLSPFKALKVEISLPVSDSDRQSMTTMRSIILELKKGVEKSDPKNQAQSKTSKYQRMLDKQLQNLDELERQIRQLQQLMGYERRRRIYRDYFGARISP